MNQRSRVRFPPGALLLFFDERPINIVLNAGDSYKESALNMNKGVKILE